MLQLHKRSHSNPQTHKKLTTTEPTCKYITDEMVSTNQTGKEENGMLVERIWKKKSSQRKENKTKEHIFEYSPTDHHK